LFTIQANPGFSAHSLLAVALTAVYRSTLSRLERDFGILTTLGTHCREHLTSGPIAVVTASVALRFSGFAAGRTSLGLIGVALGSEELLLLDAESEFSTTIRTLEGLFLEAHWMTSSLH